MNSSYRPLREKRGANAGPHLRAELPAVKKEDVHVTLHVPKAKVQQKQVTEIKVQ